MNDTTEKWIIACVTVCVTDTPGKAQAAASHEVVCCEECPRDCLPAAHFPPEGAPDGVCLGGVGLFYFCTINRSVNHQAGETAPSFQGTRAFSMNTLPLLETPLRGWQFAETPKVDGGRQSYLDLWPLPITLAVSV